MANKTTILALATAASALATAASALAEECGGESTVTTAPDEKPEATEAAPTGRGRGRGKAAPAAEEEPAKSGVQSYDELKDLIKPLVEEKRGEEVKKVIAKYGASLKEIADDKKAAFVKDIEALSY